MAQDPGRTSGGGNRPKAANASQSAKDKSRAQSRPISGKAPTGKSGSVGGGGKGGRNTPRPGAAPKAPAPARRVSGAMMAWGAVGLVVLIVVVLVVVKVTSGSTPDTYTPVTPIPATVLHDVTSIPQSVYNKVGINSPTIPVAQPLVLKNQPPLSLDGKPPAMLYYGAEYCPFCAAERWAMTASLSRFGTWSGLKITASSHTDTDPITHTLSFYGATLTSPYLTFRGIEQFSTKPTASGYANLENPTKAEEAILVKYSSSTYLPNTSTQGGISFPFVDIGNVMLVSGASYDPGVLSGLTWSDIAGHLDDAANPVTQAIIATSNYISAGICASTKGAPASVCDSPGVKDAAKAIKLS